MEFETGWHSGPTTIDNTLYWARVVKCCTKMTMNKIRDVTAEVDGGRTFEGEEFILSENTREGAIDDALFTALACLTYARKLNFPAGDPRFANQVAMIQAIIAQERNILKLKKEEREREAIDKGLEAQEATVANKGKARANTTDFERWSKEEEVCVHNEHSSAESCSEVAESSYEMNNIAG
ncbi:hypothetical protein BDY19DRAFT_1024843 [Irpex rosettiformis]|uniref:Uncharacterized protein n=1 Tax=Irpex rosettiformis TaxID=378272 RepID=A0ACB8UEV4_9APHY|nr:hypothetical protein BDY19DRAFT_1024843 [Irpex rosettiformis]